MKWLYTVCLVLMACLAACQTPGSIDIGGAVRDGIKAGVEAADRDNDGVITNRELKDSKNDPTFWIAIGGAVMGLLGLGGAAGAKRTANKVEVETDEQWDELKRIQRQPPIPER
jgi:hypothetical protein